MGASEVPGWALRRRSAWRWVGAERPPFAAPPGPGQESVWDYPRPPRLAPDARSVEVRLDGILLAATTRAVRVLETAAPPTFYLPPGDVDAERLLAAAGSSRCEWKGEARYWDLVVAEERLPRAAWSYPMPLPGFEPIRDFLSFYPALLECLVDGVRAAPQPGRFYGGWVTPELVGPFKGAPGSESW
jgi:uncharacterized protein (DUF427 family)